QQVEKRIGVALGSVGLDRSVLLCACTADRMHLGWLIVGGLGVWQRQLITRRSSLFHHLHQRVER
ncbi:MAG: hypothetical protein WBJ68_10675, partial [Candidatus Dechloromonas phosphoritropha]